MIAPENITLRDFFAAHALAGLLADPELTLAPDQTAEHVLDLADAMIAALAKRDGPQK